ncbi:MAG: formate/nitrite transporter family protein [Muribaculaceae bacterium]|nr:formate/nitrite transporter family protein [Muribaculaceae bacterium]
MKEKTFLARGILAGICISLGGCIYLKTGGVAGAVLFAFGLIAVVTLKLNLFTGKAQFVWNLRCSQTEQGGYVWLFSILALNIIGCLAAGALLSTPEMQESAVAIIEKRLASAPLKNGLLAIGCGFIMTLAVQGTAKGRWLPLLFGIPAFILCGLPHCVADAFYIALLPAEYMTERAGDLLMFYPAIVAGNFIGCNAYRLVESPRNSVVPDRADARSESL